MKDMTVDQWLEHVKEAYGDGGRRSESSMAAEILALVSVASFHAGPSLDVRKIAGCARDKLEAAIIADEGGSYRKHGKRYASPLSKKLYRLQRRREVAGVMVPCLEAVSATSSYEVMSAPDRCRIFVDLAYSQLELRDCITSARRPGSLSERYDVGKLESRKSKLQQQILDIEAAVEDAALMESDPR